MNDPSDNITTKIPKTQNSTSWTRFKDPRIVCVPRAFGGKDRHSKVVTLKGLRDRRVRLSVPTALQLYDLQDKLGLDQPSKVVDWLLNEAKHEIDKLPPLNELPKVKHHPTNALSSTLRKNEETMVVSDEDGVKLDARNLDLINLLKSNSNSNSFNFGPNYQNDFFSRSVSLAHLGSHHGVEEIQNFNVMAALPSTMYMPLSSQAVVPQYFFQPQKFASATEILFDPKDINMSPSSENPSSSNRCQLSLPSPNNND